METFKTVVMILILVPLIGASVVEDLKRKNNKLELKNEKLEAEMAQLKEMFIVLQDRIGLVEGRLDTTDVKLNDTEELEARVTVLEESVSDLEAGLAILTDEVDDVETDNSLQDERLNILEVEINDNENDIEELVDITTSLATQVSSLELDIAELDQRVGNLESGGGGNVTDLEARVDTLEDVTSQLTDDVSSLQDNDATQDQRIFIVEVDVADLDRRVEDLESGGGGGGNITDLEKRVETLEEMTSQLTDDVSSLEDNDVTQDERISSIEEDVTSLDQRVEDLESGGDGGGNGTDYSDSTFMAVLTSGQSSSADPVIFNDDVINPGGYYNRFTGKYTAPYDGVYQFSVQLEAYASSGVYFHINVDDSSNDSHVDGFSGEVYRSTTILLELTAGQTVHVGATGGLDGNTGNFRSYFNGFLVRPN